MARRRRLSAADLLPTDEELELAKQAEGSQATGAGIGTAIGTGVGALGGGALGLLLGPLGVGTGASLGAGLGGAAGNAIGSMIGGAVADDAERKLLEEQARRQEEVSAFELREEALRRLLGTA